MKLSLSIVAMFIAIVSFGQKLSEDFEVSTADPYQVIDAQNKQYFSTGEGTVIAIKTRGAIVTTQVLSAESMEETHRETYEDFPKYNKVQRVIQTTEGLFYLYEAYNKKEKTFSLYSRKVNTSNGKFEDNEKLFTTSRPVTKTEQNAYGKDPLTSVGQKSSMA
ncbi:MAG: hypothetical protein ACPGVI_00995, partial [Crocinitomicaceae bacterium]